MLKILLVDDHPTNLQILGLLLEQDYQIATANDGLNALNFVAQKKI